MEKIFKKVVWFLWENESLELDIKVLTTVSLLLGLFAGIADGKVMSMVYGSGICFVMLMIFFPFCRAIQTQALINEENKENDKK